MPRMPGTTWRPITRNHGGKRASTRAVILHVDAGNATSLHGWFSRADAGASSHFFVKADGTIEQYLDSDTTAWTSGEGNASTIGVETQGYGKGKWSAAQVESLAKIAAWVHKTYGVPLRLMTSSKKGEKGIGWHRLGIDGNFPTSGILAGRNARGGGELWSRSRGKECPGDGRIRQMPTILTRAEALAGTKAKPAPAKPKPSKPAAQRVLKLGDKGDDVRRLQQGLARVFKTYAGHLKADASFGPQVAAVIKEFQQRAKGDGRYKDAIDSTVGPNTRKALESYGVRF